MRKLLVLLFCIVTLGVATPPPAMQRPPDGKYIYVIRTGTQTLASSTIVFSSGPQGFTETETADLSGMHVVTQVVLDQTAMLPLRHVINMRANGQTQVVEMTFANGVVSFVRPPAKFAALSGTTLIVPDEGLASFWALAPAYAKVAGWKPFSRLMINNGVHVYPVTPTVGSDARPTGVPASDLELVATINQITGTVWYDPATLVVDHADLGSTVLDLTGSSRGAVTPPAVQTTAPEATPLPLPAQRFAEKPISFPSNGAVLRGVLDVPRSAKPVAAVVFVHGSGPATRDGGTPQNPTFKALANTLANSGVAVLRYDKRGIGQSSGSATEDWQILGSDMRAAVAFVKHQPGIDPSRVFVLGHSEGGFIVPKFANDLQVRGIIMMAAPAIPMEQILTYQLKNAPEPTREAIFSGLSTYIGIDPVSFVAKVRVPMLLLQGGKDSQIRASDFPRLVSAARKANRAVTARVFPEDDHLFLVLPSSQKMQEDREFFEPHALDPRVGATITAWIAHLASGSAAARHGAAVRSRIR